MSENYTPIIQISGLKMAYGAKEVLKNIDITIHAGKVIGYIGPNGAGKSTTVKILIGLIQDFEGEVKVKGLDPKKDTFEVKKLIGYVPENAEIYDVLSPMEYLTFTGKLQGMQDALIEERASKLLSYFGLEAVVNQRMDSFSKGMKQKVLLCSGLIHNPEILILDEPLSGLDANAVILVKDLIGELAKLGKTIFYCSHMMDVVEKVSDRIIVINNGIVVADGTIEELRGQQNTTLEQIFTSLTLSESELNHPKESIISIFS